MCTVASWQSQSQLSKPQIGKNKSAELKWIFLKCNHSDKTIQVGNHVVVGKGILL